MKDVRLVSSLAVLIARCYRMLEPDRGGSRSSVSLPGVWYSARVQGSIYYSGSRVVIGPCYLASPTRVPNS